MNHRMVGGGLSAALKSQANKTTTENGAETLSTTGDAVLDFFSRASAMRGRSAEAMTLFLKALAEDELYAIRALFNLRDVRGGGGERDLFRSILVNVASKYSELAESIIKYVPEYGRWDDLWPLLDVPQMVRPVAALVLEQLSNDVNSAVHGEGVSLLGKWLPSNNASSKTTRRYARTLSRTIGMSPAKWRRTLVMLRQRIDILENKMRQGKYELIDYEKVPSNAMRIHGRKGHAFLRNDGERFASYLAAVKGGTKSIKATGVEPYELVWSYITDYKPRDLGKMRTDGSVSKYVDMAVEAQWDAIVKSLKNGKNNLAIGDFSGSMFGQGNFAPINVSLSLSLLVAATNTGPFKDMALTFSSKCDVQHVPGDTLLERLTNVDYHNWGGSTNIQAAFDIILDTAVRHGLPQSEMPETLIIISDMQFNSAMGTNFEDAKRKFALRGYKLPTVVFWNVDARVQESPVYAFEGNVALVSGASKNIYRMILNGSLTSPMAFMMNVLDGPRYSGITL